MGFFYRIQIAENRIDDFYLNKDSNIAFSAYFEKKLKKVVTCLKSKYICRELESI